MRIKISILILLFMFGLISCGRLETPSPYSSVSSSEEPPTTLVQHYKVGLYPGHAYTDSKTGSSGNGLREEEINLEISLLTRKILENNGIEVVMTREGKSIDKSLHQAVQEMNKADPILVVSIHANAGGTTASGTEACYTVGKDTDEQSQQISQLLTESISSALSIKNRGIFPENSTTVCSRGKGQLYIHDINAPSTVIEIGFLSNPMEAELIKNRKNDFAGAIAQGIMNYLGIQKPGIYSPLDSQKGKLSQTIGAATVEPLPTAEIRDECFVFLDDVMIFDMKQGNELCFAGGEISYSPKGEYFVILVKVFEGDKDAFLFKADGSDMRKITTPVDFILDSHHEWSPDGRYFIYQSIYSCCIEPPPGVPVTKMVKYDVYSGQKEDSPVPSGEVEAYRVIFVDNDDVLNIRSGAGVSYEIIGTIPSDGKGIQITGESVVVDGTVWVPITYQSLPGWVNRFYLGKE